MPSSRALSLQLHKVSYKYPHSDKLALSGVSYTFSTGTTAIVGPNGAGKSTLVKLLTGLLEPTSGSISARQSDGTHIPLENLHRAVLFQEPSHLYLTIRQNVTMRFEKALGEDEAIYYALEKAGLGRVVKGLPDGIDTLVGAGFGGQTDLSGGQWQRLALARLMYQDAPVILLDEPVASLDPEGERAVFELFSQLAHSKVIIFTTHRYDSIPQNTKIVVLVDGLISESGTHEELFQKQRAYWSLYMSEASNKAMPIYASLPGQTDQAKHAMNGRTALSLSESAPRVAVPAQDPAPLSDLFGDTELLFACIAGNEHVTEAPAGGAFEKATPANAVSSTIASRPPTSPSLASPLRNRRIFLPALLALMLIIGMGTGFLLHAATIGHAISTPQRNISAAFPRENFSPTPISSATIYPSLAASYGGTAADLMTAEHTSLFLRNIQQSQGTIQGSFQGLGLTGPFTGTVTPSGPVQFTVQIYAKSMSLVFEGNIKIGGDMVGTFSVVNQQGQRTGESGIWNASPIQ